MQHQQKQEDICQAMARIQRWAKYYTTTPEGIRALESATHAIKPEMMTFVWSVLQGFNGVDGKPLDDTTLRCQIALQRLTDARLHDGTNPPE